MAVRKAFLDANLLVLLVVGLVDKRLVERHRRTRAFTTENYDLLLRMLENVELLCVTPNTLTEASNLLEKPDDTRFLDRLGKLIEESEETVVDSKIAIRNRKFTRIGLTDAVLLDVISTEQPLLTTDAELYGIASAKGKGFAFNFRHYQNW